MKSFMKTNSMIMNIFGMSIVKIMKTMKKHLQPQMEIRLWHLDVMVMNAKRGNEEWNY